MRKKIKNLKGFTLVELMIAVAISGFVVLGVVSTYSSIHSTVQASRQLENAQEVIRYSSHVFSRSLKQAQNAANVNVTSVGGVNNVLTVSLPAGATNCLGIVNVGALIETYTFTQPNLTCSIDGGATQNILLTGIGTMAFDDTVANMITVRVAPDSTDAPGPLILTSNAKFLTNTIDIDIALTTVIMSANI